MLVQMLLYNNSDCLKYDFSLAQLAMVLRNPPKHAGCSTCVKQLSVTYTCLYCNLYCNLGSMEIPNNHVWPCTLFLPAGK